MKCQPSRPLGILCLERGLPSGSSPPPYSIRNPAIFDFPTIAEVVEGAWADTVIRGDPSLRSACIAAARRLVDRGAVAITSNCGFFIRHQAAVAGAVNVPVAMSSLLLIPALLRQLGSAAKLAVVTADSKALGEDLLGVNNPAERSRIVIGGIEGGKLWQNEMKRPPPPTEVADIEADVVACVAQLRNGHPEIDAILFECTGFPIIAPTIRRLAKVPVYDITTLCRMTMASIA